LHDSRALHDLREEHLSRAEEIADHAHAAHERPFDDIERTWQRATGFFDILFDELDDAVHERVFEALLNTRLAPGKIRPLAARASSDRAGKPYEAIGGIGPPVEDDVLDMLEQILGDG